MDGIHLTIVTNKSCYVSDQLMFVNIKTRLISFVQHCIILSSPTLTNLASIAAWQIARSQSKVKLPIDLQTDVDNGSSGSRGENTSP